MRCLRCSVWILCESCKRHEGKPSATLLHSSDVTIQYEYEQFSVSLTHQPSKFIKCRNSKLGPSLCLSSSIVQGYTKAWNLHRLCLLKMLAQTLRLKILSRCYVDDVGKNCTNESATAATDKGQRTRRLVNWKCFIVCSVFLCCSLHGMKCWSLRTWNHLKITSDHD